MTVKTLVSLVLANVNVVRKQDERFVLVLGTGLAGGTWENLGGGRPNPDHRYPAPNPAMRNKAIGSASEARASREAAERTGAGRLSRQGEPRDPWSCLDPFVASDDGRQLAARQARATRQAHQGQGTRTTRRTGHRRTGNLSVWG